MRMLAVGDYLGPGNQITRMIRSGYGWMAFSFDGCIFTQLASPAGLSVSPDGSHDPDDYTLTSWPGLDEYQAVNLIRTWQTVGRVRIPDRVDA